MIYKSSCIKIITILAILILVFSFNPNINVKGKFDERDDEGIWSDDFEDILSVNLGDNCVYDSDEDSILLKKSQEPKTLDYHNYPNKVNVWYNDATIIDNEISKIISSLIKPDLLPGTEASIDEKESIGQLYKDDNKVLKTEGMMLFLDPAEKSYPMHRFQFKIDQKKKDLENITIKWWFGPYNEDADLKEITMYVWDPNIIIPSWAYKKTIKYNLSNIDGTSSTINEPDISQTFDYDECVSDEGYLDVLIVGTPNKEEDDSFLYTDYINVDLTSRMGYESKGTVTSKIIGPTTLGRWDRILWSESTPTNTNITIQILDENNNSIKGYETKSSPLDISSIDHDKIKLRAVLRSGSLDYTPKIKSWTVLFYKKDSYTDRFTDTYRIDEIKGLTMSSGKMSISSFFSDWPMFGKYSDNSRSYTGKTLSKPDGNYWYSKTDEVGGKFRAPVVSNGKVYVASYDKRIYAFNEIAADEGDKQEYVDRSSASYVVDSSLAVSDKYVIFGTSELEKKNQIYFLDKTNLSKEIKYIPDSDTICFSSAPVIDNKRVFITSWTGHFWNLPLFSIINPLIGGENKLIAIDLTGEEPDELWDPVDLPAGSFSTPAVGEGKIFVGCQNMWGKNLLAFDIDNGEELWNVSVGNPYGIIGKSSTVYADGKVFVLCNEKKEILSTGSNIVFAVDASTGDILWNKSIGESMVSTLYNLRLGVYNNAPVSSPAFFDETLYVLSPIGKFFAFNSSSGDIRWSIDFSNETLIPDKYTASPLVVDGRLYIITGSTIHCYDVNQVDNPIKKWEYKVLRPEESKYLPRLPADIIASPMIADGLMFVSSTKDEVNYTGRIYCFGDYKPNSYGYVKSTPIYLPKSHWWDNFSADVSSKTKNNTVLFDILDKNGNAIYGFKDLNGSDTSLSSLTSNTISFYAEFNIGNNKESYPSLNSWTVNWVPEEGIPEFNFSDSEGWINQDLADYSVTAIDKDDDGILSGLDVTSARYKLGYIPKGKNDGIYSDWLDAECNDDSGVKETTVTAKISTCGLDIKDLLNITFKISDLAGNTATSDVIDLNTDIIEPSSVITNKEIIESKTYYKSEFIIHADISDTGGSGIRKTIVKYRHSNSSDGPWDNWKDYKEHGSIFDWEFGLDEYGQPLESGWYQIVTVAIDKAGNVEEITDDKMITLCFDIVKPSIDTDLDEIYQSGEVPVFDFEISDDFKLDSLYYKPDSETSWEIVDDYEDINEKTYSITWSFPDSYWVEMNESEEHIIYFKVTDICGNEYETTDGNSPVIKKDTNASRYIDISDFSEWHWDNTYTIGVKNVSDIDIKMVKLFYKYSKDKQNWSEEWVPYGINRSVSPYQWKFIPAENDGYYKFYLQIEDTSGRIYTSSIEQVKITVFPLLETVLFLIALVLFLITAIVIIKKFKGAKTL